MSLEFTLDISHPDAACTLWLAGIPCYQGHNTACIGRFHCANAATGAMLLNAALAELNARGFAYVVGPMDGDTWHCYRLVVEGDGRPPFLLEPVNPDFYPQVFTTQGFGIIARYTSACAPVGVTRNLGNYERRLRAAGIRVRHFDPNRAEAELRAIYRLSLAAFADGFFYTPITETAFLALYRPYLARLQPELIRLAEDAQGQLQAFLFALPDYLEAASPHTLIIKTYASRYPGLGGYLLDCLHAEAAALGYRRIIHALMHEANVSQHNSAHYAQPFRRYALFGRALP